MEVLKIGSIGGNEIKCFHNAGNDVKQWGWHVLSIIYCLSTDILVDTYLRVVFKLLLRTHCPIWRKIISFNLELDLDLIKNSIKKNLINILLNRVIRKFVLVPCIVYHNFKIFSSSNFNFQYKISSWPQ